jgi:hypothetical protein
MEIYPALFVIINMVLEPEISLADCKIRIAVAPMVAQNEPILAGVLSADVNGIELRMDELQTASLEKKPFLIQRGTG